MKILIGNYSVEVKDHRYKIDPTQNFILRPRDPPKSLGTQYQAQNNTQIGRNQKDIKNNDIKLEVKIYPKKNQPIIQQPKFKPSNCPSCKQNKWLEFDKGYYCRNCENISKKQKHQIDKKVLRQDRYFSTRLNYANKKIRESWMKMSNTINNSPEDMIIKKQSLKGKSNWSFYKNLSKYYDELNIRNFTFEEDPFS